MKKGMKVFMGFIVVILIVVVLFLGYLGFIPGVSAIFGSNKPRDLGIKYTEADLAIAREKSKIEYEALPANTTDEQSIQRIGSRPVNFSLTSAEATALMNDRPFKYWPYKNVQMKFNADGSAEVSGQLIKDRLPGYMASIGISKTVSDKILQYMPSSAVFYVKCRASLTNNKVSLLDPSKVEVGRMSIPVSLILSTNNNLSNTAFAQDQVGIETELSKSSGKKTKIIEYINDHLASIKGFFAKYAYFSDNSLHFEGDLNEKELTVR